MIARMGLYDRFGRHGCAVSQRQSSGVGLDSRTIEDRFGNLEGHSVNRLTTPVYPALRRQTMRLLITGFRERDRI